MIPCNDLFLEIEVPDPTLNYFILNQDKLDNQEHFLGKKNSPIFKPLSVLERKNSRGIGEIGTLDPNEVPPDPPYPYKEPFSGVFTIQDPFIELRVVPVDGGVRFEVPEYQEGLHWDIKFEDEKVIEGLGQYTTEESRKQTWLFDDDGAEGFTQREVIARLQDVRDAFPDQWKSIDYRINIQSLGKNVDGWVYRGQSILELAARDDNTLNGKQSPDWAIWTKDISRGSLTNYNNDPRIVERQYRIKIHGFTRTWNPVWIDNVFLPYGGAYDYDNYYYHSSSNGVGVSPGFHTFTLPYTTQYITEHNTRFWSFFEGSGEDSPAVEWLEENFTWFDGVDVEPPTEPPDPNEIVCEESGQNTFIIEKSCIGSSVDLLEGWGAAKPDYIWVDLISDAAEINIERGFDPGQGIIGSPLAGVLDAVIIDPTLEGIATQRLAIGQKFRLRAGRNVVFTGVVSRMKSTHNAVDVPTLEVEALDAFGILNAQMVEQRDYETYKTRMLAATEKVGLTSLIQDTDTILNPTDEAMSGLDLLKESQDSEGSICWVDRHGTFYSTNRYWNDSMEDMNLWNTSPFYGDRRFSFWGYCKSTGDAYVDDLLWNNLLWEPGDLWMESLASFTYTTDTSQVINGITFYNTTQEIEEGTDEDGNTIMEKVNVRDTHTFESATSRRFYGDASVKLQTYLPTDELVAYADHIFSYLDTPKPRTESFTFVVDRFNSPRIPETTTIEIGEPIGVLVPDVNGENIFDARRVASIRHSITPQEWVCEINTI